MLAKSLAFLCSVSMMVASAEVFSVTPHFQYSSSIGVLGCKLANVDRIAYFPTAPDCTNMCLKLTYSGRSVTVLHIDRSEGAHDISYASWNWLVTGKTVAEAPYYDGGIPMTIEPASMDQCMDILDNGKLPLSAANSMNYITACGNGSADKYALYNIANPTCTYGEDVRCTLPAGTNQPVCPGSALGVITPLNASHPVMNWDLAKNAYVKAP